MKIILYNPLSKILLLVLFLLISGYSGCSGCNCCCSNKEMTDGEFMSITTDFGMAMVKPGFDLAQGKISKSGYEDIKDEKLKEACNRYGFSVGDYECKAKKLGKRLTQ